jgi:hypothetical protein
MPYLTPFFLFEKTSWQGKEDSTLYRRENKKWNDMIAHLRPPLLMLLNISLKPLHRAFMSG